MQDQSGGMSVNTKDILGKIKVVVQKTWPHILAKRVEASDLLLLGFVYLISTDPTEGLVWSTITNGKQLEIMSLRNEEIASLTVHSLFKVIAC